MIKLKIDKIFQFVLFIGLFFFPLIIQAENINNIRDKLVYTDGQILIKFKNSRIPLTSKKGLARFKTLIKVNKLNPIKLLPKKNIALIKSLDKNTEQLINELKDNSNIQSVQPNYIYHIESQTSPWGIGSDGTNATLAKSTNHVSGAGIIVAVIDTGVNYNHEDLDQNMWIPATGKCLISSALISCPNHGWDFIDSSDNDPFDDNGHGTHVAGTIAAEDNDLGVIGVAPDAQIMALKALDENGSGSSSDIIESINFAVDNGANIINLSIGGYEYASLENQAISDAWEAGITVVSAAGNDSENIPSFPAAFEKSIAVGAVIENQTDNNPSENMDTKLAYFSNYGFNDVVAPGLKILSTLNDGTYGYYSGTSMATPHISGVVALIKEAHPSFTPDQIKTVLKATATDLGQTGSDRYFGSGLADALSATASTISNHIILTADFSEINEETGETTSNTSSIVADGLSTTKIRAIIIDENGNFVNNQTLSLSVDNGSLSAYSIITDEIGQAEFTYTSSTQSGVATVWVDAGSYGTSRLKITLANILLVSDSVEYYYNNNFSWYYETMLKNAQVKYSRWDTANGDNEDFPTLDYLEKFDLVIWYTGDHYIEEYPQNILISYLENNGKLLLTGPDQLYQGKDITTLYTLLKAQYAGDFASDFSEINGVNLLVNENYFLGLIDDYNFFPDYINILDSGEEIATYKSGESAGVIYDGNYKTMFLPFGIESIYYSVDRDSLWSKISAFFMPITGLVLNSNNQNSVEISWDQYSDQEVSTYLVSYGTDSLAENLGELESNETSITLNNLEADTAYYVKVSANLESGTNTGYSSILNFTTRPNAPTNLKVDSRQVKNITLKWTAPSDNISSYIISYGTNVGADNIKTVTSTTTSKKISSLKSNLAYYFKISSLQDEFTTDYSIVKKIRTLPAKVNSKKIKIKKRETNQIKIKWEPVRGKNLQYVIRLMTAKGKKIKIIRTTKHTKLITGLKSNKSYKIKIRAKHKTSGLLGKYSKIKKIKTI
ncbi:MAG: S8 family serine peptidase [Patescibacteria group bacterium]